MTNAPADSNLHVICECPHDVIRQLGTDALDETEHARAACMTNRARHEHFLAGRALLRHILSAAIGHAVQPAAWRFATGPHGKPSVIPGLPQVPFSISHAEGLLVVATNPMAQIGVDLELVTGTRNTDPDLDQLTHREQAWLQRHNEANRWLAFLQLWTAKEAVSKVIGVGCSVEFREIEIDVPAGCARCPDGLSETGNHMDFDLRTIGEQGATYCLCVAGMTPPGREVLNPPKQTGRPICPGNLDRQHQFVRFPLYSSLYC
jgi:phosphopantetheinyl transferase